MNRNRKVLMTMDLLTSKEQKQFQSWLSGELTEKQTHILALYQGLVRGESISNMWNDLFPHQPSPEEPLKHSGLRKLEFQLNQYLESFLAIRTFLEDETNRELYVVKALNRRKAVNLFWAKQKKIRAKIFNDPIRDASFYKVQYQLFLEEQEFRNNFGDSSKEILAPQLNENFDKWWLNEKFRNALTNLNHLRIHGAKEPTRFLDEMLRYKEFFSGESLPTVDVYISIYKALTEKESNIDVYELVYQNKNLFHSERLKDIFVLALNYYSRKSNTFKDIQHVEKLFLLYHWGIEDRLVFQAEYLPWRHYKNLITLGLRLGEYEKTKQYLEKYKKSIHEEDRADAYRINLANYHFYLNNFGKVIPLLREKFPNEYYETQARFLMIQTQYELKEEEGLLRELRALKVFIQRRKKYSPLKREVEINRIKIFEKLLKAYRKEDYEALLKLISSDLSIASRPWLKEKIKEKLES